MVEIRTILAPTDFSHHAEAALRFACGLAEKFGASLHLIHALPEIVAPVGPEPMLVPNLPPEYYQETEAQSREALQKVLQTGLGPTFERRDCRALGRCGRCDRRLRP